MYLPESLSKILISSYLLVASLFSLDDHPALIAGWIFDILLGIIRSHLNLVVSNFPVFASGHCNNGTHDFDVSLKPWNTMCESVEYLFCDIDVSIIYLFPGITPYSKP